MLSIALSLLKSKILCETLSINHHALFELAFVSVWRFIISAGLVSCKIHTIASVQVAMLFFKGFLDSQYNMTSISIQTAQLRAISFAKSTCLAETQQLEAERNSSSVLMALGFHGLIGKKSSNLWSIASDGSSIDYWLTSLFRCTVTSVESAISLGC